MVYQWYLFVLLIAVAFFSSAARQTYMAEVAGSTERRYRWLPVLMLAIPLILLAGTRPDIADTYAYRLSFRATPTDLDSFFTSFRSATKDRGFFLFTFLFKQIFGESETLYFTLIAAISIFCVLITYKKHSCSLVMSVFLFIASADYIQWNYNGMRQFLAVSVIFAATDLLLEKKYLRYCLIVLLMSTIHASALVMLPVMLVIQGKPWNKRTVLFTMGVFIAINFSSLLREFIAKFMEETQYSGEVEQFLQTEGTNIFRVLVFCIPPLLSLLYRRQILRENNPLLNLAVNMSIVSMGAYIVSAVTSGIFVGRIPIYFSLYNYILLPKIVELSFEKRSQKLVYAVIIACYLCFYYYQVAVVWEL